MAASCSCIAGIGVAADPALRSLVDGKQGFIAIRYSCDEGCIPSGSREWHKANSPELHLVRPGAARSTNHGIRCEGDACRANAVMESPEFRRRSIRRLSEVLSVFPHLLFL